MYDKKIIYGVMTLMFIIFFLYAKYSLGWFYKGISLSIIPPGKWRSIDDGVCSTATKCGQQGIQRKLVQCYDPKTGLETNPDNCSDAIKPKSVLSCDGPKCANWVIGKWDKEHCPVCGKEPQVTRKRSVTCPTGSFCDISKRPTDKDICQGIDLCKWVMSDWDQPCPDCNPPPVVIQNRTLIGCQSGNDADCSGTPPKTGNVCPRRDCMWKTGDWVSSDSVPPPIV